MKLRYFIYFVISVLLLLNINFIYCTQSAQQFILEKTKLELDDLLIYYNKQDFPRVRKTKIKIENSLLYLDTNYILFVDIAPISASYMLMLKINMGNDLYAYKETLNLIKKQAEKNSFYPGGNKKFWLSVASSQEKELFFQQ